MVRAGGVLVCALVVGCGGGGSPSSGVGPPPDPGSYQTAQGFCRGSPKLTGGDLVGTWTVVAACAISTGSPANCADTTLSLTLDAQGTLTFGADMSCAIDVTVTQKKQSTVATSCGGDCAALQAKLAIEVSAGTAAGASASCAPSSADASRCACEQDFAPRAFQGSSTYRFVLPNYLDSGCPGVKAGFAVQGDTLRLDGATVGTTEFDLIAQRV
jgi:hypothetical protein